MSKLGNRWQSVRELLAHLIAAQRWFFIPLVVVLLLAALLLLATGGLSYVAPFVYTLF